MGLIIGHYRVCMHGFTEVSIAMGHNIPTLLGNMRPFFEKSRLAAKRSKPKHRP